MQYSSNYKLKLMEGTDTVKRQDFVDNFTTIDTTLGNKAEKSHNHDDRYYTESEINSKINTINNSINGKANSNHTHSNYFEKNGGFFTGTIGLVNNALNVSGDDCYFGDQDIAGHFCIKGKNGNTGLAFLPNTGNTIQKINTDGNGNMYIDGIVHTKISGSVDLITADGLTTLGDIIKREHDKSNFQGAIMCSGLTDLPRQDWGFVVEYYREEYDCYRLIAHRATTNESYSACYEVGSKSWRRDWSLESKNESTGVTLRNGWEFWPDGFHGNMFTQNGNWANVSMLVRKSTSNDQTVITQTPYRPTKRIIDTVLTGDKCLEFRIETNGEMRIATSGYSSGNWVAVNITYPLDFGRF